MSKNYNNEILNDCSWFAEKHRGKNKQSGAHWSTIIRFTPLFDEAVRLQKRVDTLEAYIADYCAPTISEKYNETEHLQQRIAELEQERRWIPISERLPEMNKTVLVVCGSVTIAKRKVDIIRNYCWVELDGMELKHVTYWQPLPQPPQEKE